MLAALFDVLHASGLVGLQQSQCHSLRLDIAQAEIVNAINEKCKLDHSYSRSLIFNGVLAFFRHFK